MSDAKVRVYLVVMAYDEGHTKLILDADNHIPNEYMTGGERLRQCIVRTSQAVLNWSPEWLQYIQVATFDSEKDGVTEINIVYKVVVPINTVPKHDFRFVDISSLGQVQISTKTSHIIHTALAR